MPSRNPALALLWFLSTPPCAGAACACRVQVDVFTPLQSQLSRLWHLWELALLGKPLLVMSPSPSDCSAAVAALISLMAPVPFSADFRPYYTIQVPGRRGGGGG